MSADKITELEKDMAVMKATVPQLIEEMRASTKAQIELTGELRQTNVIAVELKSKVSKHDERIQELESKDRVRDAADDTWKWIKRAVVLAIVGAIMALIINK